MANNQRKIPIPPPINFCLLCFANENAPTCLAISIFIVVGDCTWRNGLRDRHGERLTIFIR